MHLQKSNLLVSDAYINGKWVSGETQFDVTDPASGSVLARVADLGAAETMSAIEAAHAAWPAWRERLADARSKLLQLLCCVIPIGRSRQ